MGPVRQPPTTASPEQDPDPAGEDPAEVGETFRVAHLPSPPSRPHSGTANHYQVSEPNIVDDGFMSQAMRPLSLGLDLPKVPPNLVRKGGIPTPLLSPSALSTISRQSPIPRLQLANSDPNIAFPKILARGSSTPTRFPIFSKAFTGNVAHATIPRASPEASAKRSPIPPSQVLQYDVHLFDCSCQHASLPSKVT